MAGMRRLVPLSAPLLAVLMTVPAAAQETTPAANPLPLPADTRAHVIEVVDADTVRVGNGREVRLVGLQGPKLPLGRPNFRAWPLAEEARAHLVGLVEKRDVTLHFGGAREDRHGRILAHLVNDAGIWVQGAMLEAGFARVYTFADNRALIGGMLLHEASARAHRRGIWAHPFYRIRGPEELARDIDSFQIVEARALKATKTRDRTYLNFGADYRTDFTVAIARRDLAAFGRGFDPTFFEGKTIRVRGWVERLNGPLIDATHPEQIEVLDP